MSSDERFMTMAVKLAARGGADTRPNPRVGAVVVRSGRVVGAGFHRKAGGPHAEVTALRRAGRRAKGATLYVSLEPCAHVGRTGPCVERIAAAGISRVVAAMIDPNPRNKGKGLRRLRAAGIRTRVGVLEKEAAALNPIFITWITKRRPFVTVKVAQSIDGKIATASGDSRWVSGPQARAWVHRLRADVDAILVGVKTVLTDDPRLTVRPLVGHKTPLKIILDTHLRTPPSARIFSSRTPVLIAAGARVSPARKERLQKAGAQIVQFPSVKGRVNLVRLWKMLAAREITHLLIEGGGEVIAAALEAGLVDRFQCIVAPKIIGGREAPTAVGGKGIGSMARAIPLSNLSLQRLGKDILMTADLRS